MLAKDWLLAPPAPPEHLKLYTGISPIVAQVLYNRGLTNPTQAFAYLTAERNDSFDPFKMKDMAKAVGRLRTAITKQEIIVVYGDFDADGATSTALMMRVLKILGANAHAYIPHRVDEGYGLNKTALYRLAKRGAKVIVTVDCGIRSIAEIEAGNHYGLDIIVTDHHSLGPDLPDAFAVVNPKRDNEPVETMLAGVGVAFKFAEALLKATRANGGAKTYSEQNFDINTQLDLVAIGTVADLVPLNRLENRLLVRRGLRVLNQAERPGIRALMEVAGIAPGQVDATTIGFSLGPRINAAGRLESAMLSYELLFTQNEQRAKELAVELQDLNTKRQELTREAQEVVRAELDTDVPLIFAQNQDFPHGIVGLVAGRLTEEFYKPSIVLREGEEESSASCRSIPQFDITQALDACSDLLIRHGGHAQAAGFTVINENIPELRKRLSAIAHDQLSGQELRPSIDIDVEVDVHHLSEDLVEEFISLEPTGHNNAAPILMSSNVFVSDWRPVGKDDKHIKLKISRAGQPPLDAIGFNLGDWLNNLPERIDVVYHLEINEWNGRRNLQMNLKDIRPAGDISE